MAERLTEIGLFIDEPVYIIKKWKKSAAINKLAQLEDILEKYGIKSVELLEHIIKKGIVINSTIEDFAKEEYDKMKQDRDTWHKACEFLAYEYAEEYFDGRDIEHCFNADKRDKFVKENINHFYQQAKKEGNDE